MHLLSSCVVHLPVIFRCHTSTCYLSVLYIYLLSSCVVLSSGVIHLPVIFRCHTSTCYLPVSYSYLLTSGVIHLPVIFRCHTSTCYLPVSYIYLLFSGVIQLPVIFRCHTSTCYFPVSYIYLLFSSVIHLPVIFRCHTSTCYFPVSYVYLVFSGVIHLPGIFRCHTSTCYFPISYINLLFSCVMIFSSWTVVILFYPAAHFTFSVGYKKFRTRSASKLVFKARKHDHVQPLLQALHWLPVQARIDYKLSTICHNFFSDSSPAYVSDLLTVCRQLRSSADTRILRIPHVRTKTFGQRSFSYCAPKL